MVNSTDFTLELFMSENINPIISLAANALPGEKKYILFAGAGVSKDAGIPTAWDVMLKTAGLLYAESVKNEVKDPDIDLEIWLKNSQYGQMSYAEMMDQIYPNYPDQQSFLNKALGKQPIGDVHLLIAEIARRGIIRAIITTNFDDYLEKALEENKIEVQVISNTEDLTNCEPLIQCKKFRIYKPHGTLGRGAIRNTSKDLEKLSTKMEEELVRVLSEHGVIVLGYSGRDNGIITVFKRRNHNRYPLFWVDPKRPTGDIEIIFDNPSVKYLPCVGASQFLDEFIKLQDMTKEYLPRDDLNPTIFDLRVAYSKNEPMSSKIQDFLKLIYKTIEAIQPDFSKYNNDDEAIVEQIDVGKNISTRFIEFVQLVCEYKDEESLRIIYEYFGSFLKLYDKPDNFNGSYHLEDFDGNRFLVYEMFVAFIGSLIKYNRWELIGKLLSKDLFVDKIPNGEYQSFEEIRQHIRSLDDIRNSRLHLNQQSISADIINEHFTQEQISRLLSHQEFMDADFFLYLISRYRVITGKSTWDWIPISCAHLEGVPSFLIKSERTEFLSQILIATGIEDKNTLIKVLNTIKTDSPSLFMHRLSHLRIFSSFDPEKIGTC